jgi:hypothetical protein
MIARQEWAKMPPPSLEMARQEMMNKISLEAN